MTIPVAEKCNFIWLRHTLGDLTATEDHHRCGALIFAGMPQTIVLPSFHT
jgi:hypothetical protein